MRNGSRLAFVAKRYRVSLSTLHNWLRKRGLNARALAEEGLEAAPSHFLIPDKLSNSVISLRYLVFRSSMSTCFVM